MQDRQIEVGADPQTVDDPRVSLGDATVLTLGEGGTGSEDKRYEYNIISPTTELSFP